MKINHCINSNFGRTKHEKEKETTSPCNNVVNWSYYTALVAAEYEAFFWYNTQGKTRSNRPTACPSVNLSSI
jgi:hypothetical protein